MFTRLGGITFMAMAVWGLVFGMAYADVVRDGSVGPDAGSQASGPNYVIDESMGQLLGTNLFHSFLEFSLNSSQSVTFNAVSPVDNVISRVTGGLPSRIDGAITSNITDANFFLINPYGVVFGQNASVNVSGDFHVSSADYLRFSDDTLLDTVAVTPILGSATPQSFGFSGLTVPGSIAINDSVLQFTPGSAISMVGGDITITAGTSPVITAAGGKLQLVSLTSAAEVNLDGSLVGQNITYGNINLSGVLVAPAVIDPTLSDDAPDPVVDISGPNGGSVLMRGENIEIHNFSIAAHNQGDTDGEVTAIDITANNLLTLSGNTQVSSISEAAGRAGNISVQADTVTMLDDAEILSDTFGSASGGELSLNAREVLLLGDAEVASDVEGNGAGGSVVITADTITIGEEAEISSDTTGTGAGGSVLLNASEGVYINDEGGIFTDTQSAASAGDITINASELIIRGIPEGDEPDVPDDDGPDTDVGGIDRELGVFSFSTGAGDAGNITINTNNMEMHEGAAIAAFSTGGNGGNITINSADQILLRSSEISANVNAGVGGNINLSADLVAIHDSDVVAQAGAGQGGAITVESQRFFQSESLISASAGPAGISGTVKTPPKVDLSGSLAPLDTEFLDVQSLFQAECAARQTGKQRGSFVVIPARARPATVEGIFLSTSSSGRQEETLPVLPRNLQKGEEKTDPEDPAADGLHRALRQSLLAREEMKSGNVNEIQGRLEQALKMLNAEADGRSQIYGLIHLGNSYRMLFHQEGGDNPNTLLKAFELLKSARSQAAQQNLPRAMSFALGNLAMLYHAENRVNEALYLVRQAIQYANSARVLAAAYRWSWLEGKLLWSAGDQTQALKAFTRAVAIVSASRHEALVNDDIYDAYFEQEVVPVYMDQVNALLIHAENTSNKTQKSSLLLRARASIENFKAAELRDYYRDPCIAEVQAKTRSLDEVIGTAAVVYPIVMTDRIELLITLPADSPGTSNLHQFRVDVASDQLEREAELFRLSMERVNTQAYLGHARKLYDWLVKPYLNLLQSAQVDTLVFVPDGVLRTVPMAALHDGQQFLIEQYATAITPGLKLVDPRPIDRKSTRLLLAGLSQAVGNFPALPKVPDELNYIQQNTTALSSTLLLDETFQLDMLQASLSKEQPSIVHIASHAEFGGNHEDNFVQAFDGRITMDRLSDYVGVARFREQPVELLVLSACETAEGDNDAALGLAGVAIQAGARSAMGSLWRIADDATYKLVTDFYSQLALENVSKAKALQHSQLNLLADPQFQHPYYWSPYLLISNWF